VVLFYFQPVQIEDLYIAYLASTGITTDTRNISEGNIFFALKGDKFNANEFAEEALNKGAAYVVIDELINLGWKEKYDERLILVEDVLETLQQLAGYHRQQLKCPVLAITGSNGKTTTKELVAAVVSKKYKTYATKGNLNNHIGIPLTLLSIKSDVQFAVIEMGANHRHEIEGYCEYVKPDFGLITNIGKAHLEGFGGLEGVAKGKSELYDYLSANGGKVFANADDEIIMKNLLERFKRTDDVIPYGTSDATDRLIVQTSALVISTGETLSIRVPDGPDSLEIHSQLVGNYNFPNVLAAVCIGRYFNVPDADIKTAIENYIPSNSRSQKIVQGSNTIILDAYNANPSSMMEALKNFEKINTQNKVAIIGQMMELGEYAEAEHRKIVEVATATNWQHVKKVFVGDGFKAVVRLTSDPNTLWFEKTDEVKQWFSQQHFQNAAILIKGSRKNELEKILKD
jgi:UDP-N-acetylmuramoyl-tripeptide--D-alanyl-D-alanine ligase